MVGVVYQGDEGAMLVIFDDVYGGVVLADVPDVVQVDVQGGAEDGADGASVRDDDDVLATVLFYQAVDGGCRPVF